jgi:hypothetical protein
MATRDELVAALVERCAWGSRRERGLILDEFVAVTKFHRKHATRLLKGGSRGRPSGPRPARRIYNDAAREVRIPIQGGHVFRFDGGQRSHMIPATIPI